ncbi:hypothetical protein B5K11_26880 [Rhizobium leguminosarum bv. trifolii]|uniref:dimethylsulfonioproprionate lyase family protein n=1 Tax=Rhizobium leguminosarum TaxID=384 RepID=UPI000E2FD17E|nr:dimethylsulfonioproprionate lyase family protein [Rhizobium leguminosarum]RFB87561.1 hypothetical protein B5K11_26880 [Rhizobium leguminosarum bv. trifolii]
MAQRVAITRNADLLVRDPTELDSAPKRAWGASRPRELQEVLTSLGDVLLADSVPLMAKFNAAKIIGMLDKSGPILAEPSGMPGNRLTELAKTALSTVCNQSPAHRSLVIALLAVFGRLDWYKGKYGPFGSVNFEENHQHALLVGPGALEHRTDLRIGLTVLAPYTRFPDHHQNHSRVFLPLTFGEFRFGDDDWIYSSNGEVLFNPAGRQCAIRCTAKPLVTLWCHIEGHAG